jgi:ubiquinone biosynthesis monooxygenase Coq6
VSSKLKVALVESQNISRARTWTPKPSHFSNRCSSLTPPSVSFLEKIGAWQHVDASRVQPYEEMQVWDGETGSRISFDWSMQTSALEEARPVATMTENANLTRALLSRIAGLGDEGLSIFSGTTVTSIENGIDYVDGPDLSAWPVLSLSPLPSSTANSQTDLRIAARLLIGADGINSPVRSFAAITTDGWDYDRQGVVATLSLSASESLPGRTMAYQRFLPSLGGPIALLPLPNNNASLVWSTTVQNAAYLKSLSPNAFIAMVNAAFRLSMVDLQYMLHLDPSSLSSAPSSSHTPITPHEDELSWRLRHSSQPPQTPPVVTAVQEGSVASFPLRYRHASTYISPRIALVGDAAHVIHPLAGQGLNLGLGDVASLSNAIDYAISHGMDIGDYLSLERYAFERWAVNAKVGGVCDLLHKVYNVSGQGPVAWARSLGLRTIDQLPAVKSFLMRQAEG